MKEPDPQFLRRLGRFRVSEDLIRSEPQNVQVFLSSLLILEAKHRWDCQAIEYLAASTAFEVVPPELEAPEYSLTVSRTQKEGDGTEFTSTFNLSQ